jgi:hypothetical protein
MLLFATGEPEAGAALVQVLGRGEGDPDARNEFDGLPSVELLPAEGPLLAHDEVDLEGGARIDDVEREAATQGVPSTAGVDIVALRQQAAHELLELPRRRVDDDVRVVRQARPP